MSQKLWNPCMKLCLRLVVCLLMMALVGCANHFNKIVGTQSIAQCKQICIKKYQDCAHTCLNNCRNCSAASLKSSYLNFLKYTHEQRIEGGIITRELNSYRDPLQCRKITCNCSADFSACSQGCTGIIQKRLRAAPYCT